MSSPRFIELIGPTPKGWGATSVAERWVSAKFADELYLYEIETFHSVEHPVMKLPDVTSFDLTPTRCVTAHSNFTISLWSYEQSWKLQRSGAIPESLHTSNPISRVKLSSSGMYLHIHLSNRTLLYRCHDWELICSLPNTGATTQFCFFTMPSGRELAYTTTNSYLEVTIIDCATGNQLYHQDPKSLFDLIHLSMQTTPDGKWLLASGMVWADKPELLVYNIQDWEELLQTSTTPTLPWEQTLRFFPWVPGEEFLMPEPDAIQDGVLHLQSFVEPLSELAEEIDEDDEYFEDHTEQEREILMTLYKLQHNYRNATIKRWISLDSKEVLSFEIEGFYPVDRPPTSKYGLNTQLLPESYKLPEGKHQKVQYVKDLDTWVIRVWQEAQEG